MRVLWTARRFNQFILKEISPEFCVNLFKMPDWMKHKLESRFLGEISITSDMQTIPPFWQKVKRN